MLVIEQNSTLKGGRTARQAGGGKGLLDCLLEQGDSKDQWKG